MRSCFVRTQRGKPVEEELHDWWHHPRTATVPDQIMQITGDEHVSFVFTCKVRRPGHTLVCWVRSPGVHTLGRPSARLRHRNTRDHACAACPATQVDGWMWGRRSHWRLSLRQGGSWGQRARMCLRVRARPCWHADGVGLEPVLSSVIGAWRRVRTCRRLEVHTTMWVSNAADSKSCSSVTQQCDMSTRLQQGRFTRPIADATRACRPASCLAVEATTTADICLGAKNIGKRTAQQVVTPVPKRRAQLSSNDIFQLAGPLVCKTY